MKVCEVIEAILKLLVKKNAASWAPRLLNQYYKNNPTCRNPTVFLRTLLSMQHGFTTTLHKQEDSRNNEVLESYTVKSANKVMATVFWDAKGIIFIDYLDT